MRMLLHLVTFWTLTGLVVAEKENTLKTRYFGPPPKPVPGENWMQAAVRELRKQRCPGAPACSEEEPEPLGMEDGRILTESITASSSYTANHGPFRARLNTQDYPAAWAAVASDVNPWIQVDFTTTVTITGLITQGRGEDGDTSAQRVTKYQVAQSDDGQSWDDVTYTNGTIITFPGNINKGTTVTNRFPKALHTRFIRILPTEWNNVCSMRFEVIGCY